VPGCAPDYSLLLSGRFQYQVRNRIGLRYERNVACFDLDRLRAHALRHEALQVRVDSPVFRRDGVPARLRSPCRVGGLVVEQRPFERNLDGVENPRSIGGQVAGEVAQKCLLTQPSLVVGEDDAGGGRWCWKALGQGRVVFVRIGRARRDVNDGRNLGIDAGLGEDHAAEGMSHQDRWPLLHGEDALRRLHAGLQRRQRILHGRDLHAFRLQPCDDFGPARPVRKKTVYEDDIPRLRHGLCNSDALQKRTGRAGNRHANEAAPID